MKGRRFVHWLAVASLAYCVFSNIYFARSGVSITQGFSIGLWIFLLMMLYSRPKAWGLGIGILMLFTIVFQIGLWRLALNSPQAIELGIDDSWLRFSVSVFPHFIGGICSIILSRPDPLTTKLFP